MMGHRAHQKSRSMKGMSTILPMLVGLALASCTGTVQELKQKGESHSFTTPGRYDRLGACYLRKMQEFARPTSYETDNEAHGFHDPIKKFYRVTYGTYSIYGHNPLNVMEFYPAGEGMTKVVLYQMKPIINLGGDPVVRVKEWLADCPRD